MSSKNNLQKFIRATNIILLSILIQIISCINEVEEGLLMEWQNYNVSKLLYSNNEGIHVLNFKTGKNSILAKNGEIMNYYPYGEGYFRRFARDPHWSPDGKRIVYVEEDGGTDYSQITIMDAYGNNKRTIVHVGIPSAPCWHPNGSEIVFIKSLSFGSNPEIFTINVDGTNERQLTNLPGNVSNPSFSRDGQKIVFASEDSTKTSQIFIMNYDGSDVLQLTYQTELFIYANGASLSPVTDEIVFSGKDDKEPDHEIFLLRLSDMNTSQLTDKYASDQGLFYENIFPSWSRDGRFIVYCQYPNRITPGPRPLPSVCAMRQDGSQQQQIISNAQYPDIYLRKYSR